MGGGKLGVTFALPSSSLLSGSQLKLTVAPHADGHYYLLTQHRYELYSLGGVGILSFLMDISLLSWCWKSAHIDIRGASELSACSVVWQMKAVFFPLPFRKYSEFIKKIIFTALISYKALCCHCTGIITPMRTSQWQNISRLSKYKHVRGSLGIKAVSKVS